MKYRNEYNTITAAILLFILIVWIAGIVIAVKTGSIIKTILAVLTVFYSFILVMDWLLT